MRHPVIRLRPTIHLLLILAAIASGDVGFSMQSSPVGRDARVVDFEGKVVRIVVGFPPGGGADVYARLIARHLGRFVPGHPIVVVNNMPGAGSIVAGNYIFNSAARDGTEIGMLNGAVILEQLFRSPGVRFDMENFRYLAVPVNETYVLIVARRSGIRQFAELLGQGGKQVVLGAIPNSTLEHAAILLRDALNAKVKIVSGYKGRADIRLAIDSGEIDGFFNPWSTIKPTARDKFKSGGWSVIAQLTDQPVRDLPSSGIPTITELTQDETQRALLRYGTNAPNQFGKVYVLPGGVPADRAAVLEEAFVKTFSDKNFLSDAEKSNLEITPIFGSAIQTIVTRFLNMPPAIKESLHHLIKK